MNVSFSRTSLKRWSLFDEHPMCAMGLGDTVKAHNTLQCGTDSTKSGVIVKALVDGFYRRARVLTFQELVGYSARIYRGLPFSRVDVTYTDDDGDTIHVVEECEFEEAVRFICSVQKQMLRMRLKNAEQPLLSAAASSTDSYPQKVGSCSGLSVSQPKSGTLEIPVYPVHDGQALQKKMRTDIFTPHE